MKRNQLNETKDMETQEVTETGDNVLNFSTTLKELRKTVDPHLVRQRAGRRDRNGNVQMVEYVEWHTVADILDETAPQLGPYSKRHSVDRRDHNCDRGDNYQRCYP
jgi:hypothetical protein